MGATATFTRRSIAAAGLGALALPLARRRGASGAAVPAAPPNVILILTDDMRADDLDAMSTVRERIGGEGTTFNRAFVTTPLCGPSRASILRGQYAHNHGVLDNDTDGGAFAAMLGKGLESSTVATWLQASGYRTGLLGKYLNGYPGGASDQTYVPPGWETWVSAIGHGGYAQYDYTLNENGTLTQHGEASADYLTTVLGDRAETFIDAALDDPRPFFLYLAPFAPHSPSTPPPGMGGVGRMRQTTRGDAFNEQNVRDKPEWVRNTPEMGPKQVRKVEANAGDRYASLQGVDVLVGRVLDALDRTGAAGMTYVFFASDNGQFLGEHRQAHGKNGPYDEAAQVPLVVRGPAVRRGASVDGLALNIDLAPTMAELAGVPIPSFVDGRSLVPSLTGRVKRSRSVALVEGFAGTGGDSPDGNDTSVPSFNALRGDEFLYVEYQTRERELYDLAADPQALENVADKADRDTLATLSKRLARLTRASGASARSLEDASLAFAMPEVRIREGKPGRKARDGSRNGSGANGKRDRAPDGAKRRERLAERRGKRRDRRRSAR